MATTLDQRRAHFIAWMEREATNVNAVAARSGIAASTLYTYVRGPEKGGTGKMSAANEGAIAEAYGVSAASIFEGRAPRTVPVRGRIGARAEVFPIDDGTEPAYEIPLPPLLSEIEEFEGFEVEGISMPPARPGWVILFRKRQLPLNDLVGFPCLIDLTDGRRLFKVLRKGYAPDRWNLESWDGSPLIEDVQVVAALPFASMTPGRMAR